MGVAEIRHEVEKCEASIQKQQQFFSEQRKKIVDEIKPFVKERIKYEVESEVKRNSEHTKELGRTALSEMKRQLVELLENSDQVVDEAFSDDSVWIHVNYKILPDGDRFGQRYNNEKKAKENIQNGIKTIIGEAGKILLDNKYISVGNQYRWNTSSKYGYTHVSQEPAKLIYAYGLVMPKNLEMLIDEYSKDIGTLHENLSKLLELKRKLSEQEAADLWDEV